MISAYQLNFCTLNRNTCNLNGQPERRKNKVKTSKSMGNCERTCFASGRVRRSHEIINDEFETFRLKWQVAS